VIFFVIFCSLAKSGAGAGAKPQGNSFCLRHGAFTGGLLWGVLTAHHPALFL
jgi:hypothetical protein